jgi:hypothetical protein
MVQQYGGNDFTNQNWGNIIKALQSNSGATAQDPGAMDPGDRAAYANLMNSIGNWNLDSYQVPGTAENGYQSPYIQLTKKATNQSGITDPKSARYDTVDIDPNTMQPVSEWQQSNYTGDHGGLFSNIVPILGAVLSAGGLSGAFGTGADAAADGGAALGGSGGALGQAGDYGMGALDGSGASAATATEGYSIPTADELSAAGFGDGTGIGMTGAGGIGSVDSVAGALGPASYTDLGYTGAGGLLDSLASAAKSALTPSNIAKVAAALKGAGGGSSSGGAGLHLGGPSGVFNQVANETPGMISTQTQMPQQQQLAQALLLGDPGQQKFSPLQFNPVQLAQAFRDV